MSISHQSYMYIILNINIFWGRGLLGIVWGAMVRAEGLGKRTQTTHYRGLWSVKVIYFLEKN